MTLKNRRSYIGAQGVGSSALLGVAGGMETCLPTVAIMRPPLTMTVESEGGVRIPSSTERRSGAAVRSTSDLVASAPTPV
jgi:hypothetical protein